MAKGASREIEREGRWLQMVPGEEVLRGGSSGSANAGARDRREAETERGERGGGTKEREGRLKEKEDRRHRPSQLERRRGAHAARGANARREYDRGDCDDAFFLGCGVRMCGGFQLACCCGASGTGLRTVAGSTSAFGAPATGVDWRWIGVRQTALALPSSERPLSGAPAGKSKRSILHFRRRRGRNEDAPNSPMTRRAW